MVWVLWLEAFCPATFLETGALWEILMSPPTNHLPIHLLTTYPPPTHHLLTTYRPPTNHLQIITVQLVNYSCIPALLFNFILMITFADSEDEDFNPDNPNSDEDQDVKEE